MKLYRTGFFALAFSLLAMLVVTSAKAQVNFGPEAIPTRYDFSSQAALAPTVRRVARNVVRQFEPRQVQNNVRAVIAAPVRATDWITQRARDAKNFFMRRGYSSKASAAIAGHLVTESAMNTQIRGDGGMSVGLAQWNGQRLVRLRKFAADRGADWHDFDTQLAFIEHELETTETVARDALRRSRNITEATAAFMHFERPLGYSPQAPARGHGWASRLYHAKRLHAAYQAEVADLNP